MYTVCLVEDEPDSRELFVEWLRGCKRLQLLGAYGTAEDALREVPRVNPDVILMDIRLPGKSGIDCLIALRHLVPPCNATVVMLTEYEDSNLIFHALKAGAEGYLLKRHASPRELQAAIVEVMAGGRPFNRTVAQQVTAFFRTLPPSDDRRAVSATLPANLTECARPRAQQRPTYPTALGHSQAALQSRVSAPGDGRTPLQQFEARILTPREQEVLRFTALGLTYKEVASGMDISVETVSKHLQSIFRKLHIHCRTDPRLYSAASSFGQLGAQDSSM